MKANFYIWAALLGGIVMFVWGSIVHLGLPWWHDVMHEFPNEQAVVDVLNDTGVQNGMYFGMQGLLMVVFLDPAHKDATEAMGSSLIVEFVSNLLVAFLLAWLLVRTNVRGLLNRAGFTFAVGTTAWFALDFSYWNWYQFPFGFILLEFVELGIGFFLAGLAISWLMEKTAKTA